MNEAMQLLIAYFLYFIAGIQAPDVKYMIGVIIIVLVMFMIFLNTVMLLYQFGRNGRIYLLRLYRY